MQCRFSAQGESKEKAKFPPVFIKFYDVIIICLNITFYPEKSNGLNYRVNLFFFTDFGLNREGYPLS